MTPAELDGKACQYRQDIRQLEAAERDLTRRLTEARATPCAPGTIGDINKLLTKAKAQREVKEMLLNRLLNPGLFDAPNVPNTPTTFPRPR